MTTLKKAEQINEFAFPNMYFLFS